MSLPFPDEKAGKHCLLSQLQRLRFMSGPTTLLLRRAPEIFMRMTQASSWTSTWTLSSSRISLAAI